MSLRKLVLAVIAMVLVGACSERDSVKDAKRVSLAERTETVPAVTSSPMRTLRVTVGSMITPSAGFSYYTQLLRYLEDKIGIPVKFVDRHSYDEINALLRDGDTDLAFVCGGPYVEGHDEFGLDLLVAPRAYGDVVYYSYIIVQKAGDIHDFGGLRGKHFAFADPKSNSGALVPTHMLAEMGETPEAFFSDLTYTYAHDKSIKAVAQGVVDGAAVDSLIWEYDNRADPVFTSKTRIIAKSPPFGIPPVVTGPNVDPRLKQQLREIFLHAHEDPLGKKILDGMMIEKFVLIEDSAYDSIRDMKRDIADKQLEPAQ
jgi:phosphonate transport system substrate-binding protein